MRCKISLKPQTRQDYRGTAWKSFKLIFLSAASPRGECVKLFRVQSVNLAELMGRLCGVLFKEPVGQTFDYFLFSFSSLHPNGATDLGMPATKRMY